MLVINVRNEPNSNAEIVVEDGATNVTKEMVSQGFLLGNVVSVTESW